MDWRTGSWPQLYEHLQSDLALTLYWILCPNCRNQGFGEGGSKKEQELSLHIYIFFKLHYTLVWESTLLKVDWSYRFYFKTFQDFCLLHTSSSHQEADIQINYSLFSNEMQILENLQHYYSWSHWKAASDHCRFFFFNDNSHALNQYTDNTQQVLPRHCLNPNLHHKLLIISHRSKQRLMEEMPRHIFYYCRMPSKDCFCINDFTFFWSSAYIP